MIKLFVCIECGKIFSEPIKWTEDRGECFGFSTYEEFLGSPCCYGNYVKTYQCDACGEWITDDYIKIGNERYCQECFTNYELGDE